MKSLKKTRCFQSDFIYPCHAPKCSIHTVIHRNIDLFLGQFDVSKRVLRHFLSRRCKLTSCHKSNNPHVTPTTNWTKLFTIPRNAEKNNSGKSENRSKKNSHNKKQQHTLDYFPSRRLPHTSIHSALIVPRSSRVR